MNISADLIYWILANMLNFAVWGGELIGAENLPQGGPAVFVANHALALGPIAVVSSMPVRFYPWVIGDVLDGRTAAAYLNRDFVEPQLHLPSLISMHLSRLISKVSVRLLCTVECIPVGQGDELLETYQVSLDYLTQGRCLLVFPEDPARQMDDQSKMRPFKNGFARLGDMYFERTQQILRFYPVMVDARSRRVRLGKAIPFNPNNRPTNERLRIARVLEAEIRGMMLDLTLQAYTGLPLPY